MPDPFAPSAPEGDTPRPDSTAPLRRPVNTYRLQLTADFGLAAAAHVLSYLGRLGVTDCYTSPYLVAAEGSLSGYDVCDHSAIQPELGGAAGLEVFATALGAASLGHVMDVVPNHMGTDTRRNRWWRDVLQYGRGSTFATYFDVDWAPAKPELRGRLLLPILGKPYGEALDDGDLRLAMTATGPVVTYGPHELPLNPATVPDPVPAEGLSADDLHALLEHQVYRLAYWRTSADEINYRRFFDVDGLIGLRMESDAVFTDAHRFLRTLIARGLVTSLRVDHPDGLAEPAAYLVRLRALCSEATGGRPLHVVVEKILGDDETLPDDWAVDGTTGYDFLARLSGLFVAPTGSVVLERLYGRITGQSGPFEQEAYRSKTLVMATTLASEVEMLSQALNRISERHRRSRDFTLNSLRRALLELVAWLPVYRTYLGSGGAPAREIARLRRASRLARQHNEPLEASVFAFLEAVLVEGTGERTAYPAADDDDASARRRFTERWQQFTGSVMAKGVEDTAFYRHHALLSANEVGGRPGRPARSVEEFHADNRLRAERASLGLLTTATHDTKLGEDARARLNVLSELPVDWIRHVRRARALTKTLRTAGEIGDMPDANDQYRFFQALVGTWPADELHAAEAGAASADYVGRVTAYMRKAVREAKQHTSWINPHVAYEDALAAFVERSLASPAGRRFRAAWRPFVARIARIGVVNSLAQLVLKLGSPGVVDVYQGAELWDLNLVDPDNRRPVDFAARALWLEAHDGLFSDVASGQPSAGPAIRALLDDWPSGRIKLYVTAAGLRLRRARPDLFLNASYEALAVDRVGPADVVAFIRRHAGGGLFVAAPRWVAALMTDSDGWPVGEEAWQGARVRLPSDLDGARLSNVLSGQSIVPETFGGVVGVPVARLFSDLPVGLWTWGTAE